MKTGILKRYAGLGFFCLNFIFLIKYNNSRNKVFWFFHMEQLSRYIIYSNCKRLLCTKLFKQILITTFNAYVHVLRTKFWIIWPKKTNKNDVILSSFWYYERIPLYSFKCEVWCISNDIHVLFSTFGTKQSNRYFSLSEHYPQNILFSYGRQITVKLIMTMILSIDLCNLGQNVSLHDIRTK